MSADPRITNSEGAEFDWSTGRIFLANTRGFAGDYQASTYSLSVSPVARDPKTGGMQRDSWYEVQRKYAKMESADAVGLEAARRTIRRLGAKKGPTKRVPVVFDQECAGSLLANLCSGASGYALYKGASFLAGRLGTRLAPDFVTIYDDGRMIGGLGSKPFDGDGLPTRKNTIVERGVLKNYLLDTYSGRKLGLPSTGNAARSVGDSPSVGPTNFYLVPGTRTPEQIIASVKDGLYVTELIGFGINMVTGDYSRGAAGFWVEGGEVARPVHEITVAGDLRAMYRGIVAIGDDVDRRGAIHCGSLLIDEMTIAGD